MPWLMGVNVGAVILLKLLHALRLEAPQMQLVVTEVQFRTVAEAIASRRIDAAIPPSENPTPSGPLCELLR